MGYTLSSGKSPDYQSAVKIGSRAALEAAFVSAVGCVGLFFLGLGADLRDGAFYGIAWAFTATTISTIALAFAHGKSAKMFWTAFGFGVLTRVGVLGGLMRWCWTHAGVEAGSLLGAYVLALAALTLIEFRHLVRFKNR